MSHDPYAPPEQPYQARPPIFPQQSPKVSGIAICSLVFGLLGLFCFIAFAVPGIILGHVARSGIRRSNGQITGSGMALTGLICGYVAFALLGGALAYGVLSGGFD